MISQGTHYPGLDQFPSPGPPSIQGCQSVPTSTLTDFKKFRYNTGFWDRKHFVMMKNKMVKSWICPYRERFFYPPPPQTPINFVHDHFLSAIFF